MIIVQVCKESECENIPLPNIEIGNMVHNFCCQKGFEKALSDYQEYLKSGKTNQNN